MRARTFRVVGAVVVAAGLAAAAPAGVTAQRLGSARAEFDTVVAAAEALARVRARPADANGQLRRWDRRWARTLDRIAQRTPWCGPHGHDCVAAEICFYSHAASSVGSARSLLLTSFGPHDPVGRLASDLARRRLLGEEARRRRALGLSCEDLDSFSIEYDALDTLTRDVRLAVARHGVRGVVFDPDAMSKLGSCDGRDAWSHAIGALADALAGARPQLTVAYFLAQRAAMGLGRPVSGVQEGGTGHARRELARALLASLPANVHGREDARIVLDALREHLAYSWSQTVGVLLDCVFPSEVTDAGAEDPPDETPGDVPPPDATEDREVASSALEPVAEYPSWTPRPRVANPSWDASECVVADDSLDDTEDGWEQPGRLDSRVIAAKRRARACFASCVTRLDPAIVSEGVVQLRMSIDAAGAVTEIEVTGDDVGDRRLASCFADILRRLHFGRARRGFSGYTEIPVRPRDR